LHFAASSKSMVVTALTLNVVIALVLELSISCKSILLASTVDNACAMSIPSAMKRILFCQVVCIQLRARAVTCKCLKYAVA
jgi:hypothetical protein